MLGGEYTTKLDPKGRIIMPSKLREELGERFYVTRWLDNCLAAFSEDEWGNVSSRVTSQAGLTRARDVQRSLFANSCVVEPDKQGRILIPANLREKGKLEKDVVVIGVYNRAEIWDAEMWAERSKAGEEAFDDQMFELDI